MDTKPAHLESLTWELRRAFRDLAAAADRELRPLGIVARDRALLEFLAREPDPITLSELARRRSVSRQHIHQSLRRLADPKWVEEIPDPDDGRNVLLRLSRKGKLFWDKIHDCDKAYFTRLAPHLDAGAVQSALQTLKQLRLAIREESTP